MIKGQVAVVTGAASGIGQSLAARLAARGVTVVATDITANGPDRVDVTDAAQVHALIANVKGTHGRLDYMFNNAGVAVGGEMTDLSAKDWQRVLDVNLSGVVNGVRAAYAVMHEQGFGHIVNVASVAGLSAYPLAIPYTTSKHAVVGLSLALRAEAAEAGVNVSVACPGAIRTPIWENSPAHGWDPSRLLAAYPGVMTADRCAKLLLRGVRRNRAVIAITAEARIMWMLSRASPALAARAHAYIARYARRKLRSRA